MVITGSLNSLTGGYIYDRKLIEHIQESGHQTQVIQLPGWNYSGRLLNSLQLALSDRLIHLPVDVLLQDELDHPALSLVNRRLQFKASYPVVSIVHHLRSSEARPIWQNSLYRLVERNYLKEVDGFIFNSLTTRHSVEDLIGEGRPSVVASPCGNITLSHMSQQEIIDRAKLSGPLRVLFVGNVIRRKGLHSLLDALSSLPENTCQLTIIGDLSMDKHYVRSIQSQINQYGLNRLVLILGSISDSELSARFKEHHVLAVPSSYEGFGMVYLEGMSYGLPAIGSTSGAAGETIAHGRNGFLIKPGDSASLAKYLFQMSEDRELLIALGFNARRHYEAHPQWHNTCNNIVNFLQRLLKG
jgi:glycosyltransferase involved in cell wall biosynthesis